MTPSPPSQPASSPTPTPPPSSPPPLGKILKDRYMLIAIFYESPWERLETLLLGINWRTLEIRHHVRDGSLLSRLADVCDDRNRAWVRRYAARGVNPPARWKRRDPGESS